MCDCMSLSIQTLVFFKISLLVTPTNKNNKTKLRNSQSKQEFEIDRRTKMDFPERLSLFIIQKKLKRRKSRLATSWVGLMTTMATRICCKGKLQVGTRLIYLNSKSASVEKMWYFMILVPFGTWFRLPKESTWAYFFMLISRRRRRRRPQKRRYWAERNVSRGNPKKERWFYEIRDESSTDTLFLFFFFYSTS